MTVSIMSLRDINQPTLWAMVLEPTPPLAPTKAKMRPTAGLGIGVKGADCLDDLQRIERRHQIFAHPLSGSARDKA